VKLCICYTCGLFAYYARKSGLWERKHWERHGNFVDLSRHGCCSFRKSTTTEVICNLSTDPVLL